MSSFNGCYGLYNNQYTLNSDPPPAFGSYNYLPTNSSNYASVPMQHTHSGSSTNSYTSQGTYASSPNEYYDIQNISSNAMPDIDVSYTAPVNTSTKGTKNSRTSSNSSNSKSGMMLHCLHPGCEYQTRRQYDLDRHQRVHFPSAVEEKFNCPGRGCGRVGEHGFDRKDHLREHLRKVHVKDIPKQHRRGSKGPGQ